MSDRTLGVLEFGRSATRNEALNLLNQLEFPPTASDIACPTNGDNTRHASLAEPTRASAPLGALQKAIKGVKGNMIGIFLSK
jgi:hypothetical protein